MFYTLIGQCRGKFILLIKSQDKKLVEQQAWQWRDTYGPITLITSSSGDLSFSELIFNGVQFKPVYPRSEYDRLCGK